MSYGKRTGQGLAMGKAIDDRGRGVENDRISHAQAPPMRRAGGPWRAPGGGASAGAPTGLGGTGDRARSGCSPRQTRTARVCRGFCPRPFATPVVNDGLQQASARTSRPAAIDRRPCTEGRQGAPPPAALHRAGPRLAWAAGVALRPPARACARGDASPASPASRFPRRPPAGPAPAPRRPRAGASRVPDPRDRAPGSRADPPGALAVAGCSAQLPEVPCTGCGTQPAHGLQS